jgi:hypothetical protein
MKGLCGDQLIENGIMVCIRFFGTDVESAMVNALVFHTEIYKQV